MTTQTQENIFIFIPNLIGYGRIILTIISFWFMPTNYVISGWCYIISVFLDSLDGHASRTFDQILRLLVARSKSGGSLCNRWAVPKLPLLSDK